MCTKICKKCFEEYNTERLKQKHCNKCLKAKHNLRSKRWRKQNLEKSRNIVRNYRKRNPDKDEKVNKHKKEKLSKSYVALSLRIKTKDLSEELYQHHKKLILFKRQIVEEQNVSIQTLK